MPLHTHFRWAAVALPATSLLSCSPMGRLPTAAPVSELLVAEAPIWGWNNAFFGYAFLPVTIHGKLATLGIDLTQEGNPALSTAALTQLDVSLADTTALDSLTIGSVVERYIAVKLNRRPNWSMSGPPGTPPVVGVIGVRFLARYDLVYDFPGRRVRLYLPPKRPVPPGAAWLPAGIKPTDCGRMVRIPPGAGTFTGVEMQLDGHPMIGVLEMFPFGPGDEKMNLAAVTVMGLTDSSPQVQPIPNARSSNHGITKAVRDVRLTVGSHTFWNGPVKVFPALAVQKVLKPDTPVMLMNLMTIRDVVLFNSVSSGQVCVSAP